jgi:prepilin-type N-terminal cleavage/methylation domain-containing protein
VTVRRNGYTLLEVLLASAIALLLMAALYVSMDVQINSMQLGRDTVEETTLVRVIVNKFNSDIAGTVGSLQPVTSSSTSTTTTTTDTTTASATSATATTSVSESFQLGVNGDSNRLTLFSSRLTRALMASLRTDATSQTSAMPVGSDVRLVTYWLATDGGLARQEDRHPTAENAGELIGDEANYVIFPEVRTLSFRYFDGSSWQDSWDGSTPGPDGKTPQGAPRAVEIRFGLQRPGREPDDLLEVRHVIGFPTSSGPSSGEAGGTGVTTTP